MLENKVIKIILEKNKFQEICGLALDPGVDPDIVLIDGDSEFVVFW